MVKITEKNADNYALFEIVFIRHIIKAGFGVQVGYLRKGERELCRKFIYGPSFTRFCEHLSIEPNYIREFLDKNPPEKLNISLADLA